jgi:hypothetical protein
LAVYFYASPITLIDQGGFGEHCLIPPRLSACLRGSPRETSIKGSHGGLRRWGGEPRRFSLLRQAMEMAQRAANHRTHDRMP